MQLVLVVFYPIGIKLHSLLGSNFVRHIYVKLPIGQNHQVYPELSLVIIPTLRLWTVLSHNIHYCRRHLRPQLAVLYSFRVLD